MIRRIWLAGLLLLLALPVRAQGTNVLIPGRSVDGTLNAETPAQVYTYNGSAGEVIKLTLVSENGVALATLVTNSSGQQVGQAQDTAGVGTLVVNQVELDDDGTYFITVFPIPGAETIEGGFSISLALEAGTEAPVTATEETPTEEVDPESDATLVPTTTPAAADDVSEAADQDLNVPLVTVDPGQILTTDGIQVSLTWGATVDYNLEVRDPVGGTVFWDSPVADSGGSFNGFNVNGNCETFTADAPTEALGWPPGAVPTGSYEILVYYEQDCESNGAVPFTVTVAVDGVDLPPIEAEMVAGQVYIARFDIAEDGEVTGSEGGINQTVLPATPDEIFATAADVALGQTLEGVVTNEQPYQAFAFTTDGGDIVSSNMSATTGSLDTFLFVVDEDGAVVASNDDADATTRNSQISGVALQEPGTYAVVATRYGQQIGGTEGNFSIQISAGESLADTLPEALAVQDVPQGIIEVGLVWATGADLQLLVRDPAGDVVYDDSPAIVSGGRLELAGNVNCTLAAGTPVSYIYWPTGTRLRPGTYEIDVWFQNTCQDPSPVEATLTTVINEQVIIADTFFPLPDEHFITTFTIGVDGSVVRGPGDIAGGSETINYQPELATSPALTSNVPVTGTISDDNRFDVYTFAGTAGETVTLQMQATAGTLDTLLFLLGPTGLEIASNDDAVPGETTDSLIEEFVLPADGQYVVLASHYGTIFGGTNGNYNLTFSRLN